MKSCASCGKTVESNLSSCPHCSDSPLSPFCPGDKVQTLQPLQLCHSYHGLQGVVVDVMPKWKNERKKENNYDPIYRRSGNVVFVRFFSPEHDQARGLSLDEAWVSKG